tara:strand:- start:2905 stop:3861 length:957 start_codon:yes stop_codon:yes gene_type:complete
MQGASSPLTDWINSDVEKAKIISIIMIIFAAWTGIEAISNVAGIEIPPETGMATNVDPDDTQRTNNGVIVGLGAVLGTVGIIIQMSIPRGTEEEEIVEESPKFDEDLVKLTKWLCSRGTTAAQFFDWADVDDSGTIDMVEFANALRQAEIANLPPWEIEELVKIMDINEDGRINLPELEIMLMKIQNTLGIDFVPYVEEETEDEEEPVEESEDDSTEEEAEEETEESVDDVAEEEAEAEDDSTEEETVEETEESEDEVAEEETEAEDDSTEEETEEETAEDDAEEETEEETEAEDDSTEEETEDEPVVEEPPKKKKKF